MEENNSSKTVQIAERLLDEKNHLMGQRDALIFHGVKVTNYLFVLLALIFVAFSLNLKEEGLVYFDENSTDLLWVIVVLDVVGLVWIATRTYQQLKRYQTCIRKLDALLLRVTITNENADEEHSGEKIYEEMKSIISVFDKKKCLVA